MKITNIKWNKEIDKNGNALPTEIELPIEIATGYDIIEYLQELEEELGAECLVYEAFRSDDEFAESSIELKLCPFCGGTVKILHEEYSTFHDEPYQEGELEGPEDAFRLYHDIDETPECCPIAHFFDDALGCCLYDTPEEAAEAWNTRFIE